MIVRIDDRSSVPPYRQLTDQIVAQVASGRLPVGLRLPPVRQLATDLGVANGTVARAYRALEEAGVLATRGRRGTFVARSPADLSDEERLQHLREKINEVIQSAVAVGATRKDVLQALQRGLEEAPISPN